MFYDPQTNPYLILKELFPKETHTSFKPVTQPWDSERLKCLVQFIPPSLRMEPFNFSPRMSFHKYVNIYDFPSKIDDNKKTIVFHAHHDVNCTQRYRFQTKDYKNVDNVIDNTGSISILLALANRIRDKQLPVNVAFAYTDAEELANEELAGSRVLANLINNGRFGNRSNVHSINLEVSCQGKNKFVDTSDGILKSHPDFMPVRTPFSDSFVMNFWGVSSSCIGILTDKDVIKIQNTGSCDTFNACHTENDTFDKANEENMNEFVSYLENLIITL